MIDFLACEPLLPDKPTWYGDLDKIVAALKQLPYPWVDRAIVQQLLGVGRRRAQQILEPCVTQRIGANGLADRDKFVQHLEQLARGDAAAYERQRRQKVAEEIGRLRQSRIEYPRLLVEAPHRVVNQGFAGLEGVLLSPGRIIVEFDTCQAALEKLLALAMAIGNDFDTFQRLSSAE